MVSQRSRLLGVRVMGKSWAWLVKVKVIRCQKSRRGAGRG